MLGKRNSLDEFKLESLEIAKYKVYRSKSQELYDKPVDQEIKEAFALNLKKRTTIN